MIILVQWQDWLIQPKVWKFTDEKSATTYAAGLPDDRTVYRFDDSHPMQQEIESHWYRFNSAQLVEVYNALAGADKPIKLFHDRDTAFRRIADVLSRRVEAAPEMVISTPPQQARTRTMEDMNETVTENDVEKPAKKARVKKEKAPAVPKGPGVISTLVGHLKNGGGTVDELHAKLLDTFPDRGDGMKTTIRVQLVRLVKDSKLKIHKEKVEGRGLVYSGEDVGLDDIAAE